MIGGMPFTFLYFGSIFLLVLVGALYFSLRLRRREAGWKPISTLLARQSLPLEEIRGPVTVLLMSGLVILWMGLILNRRIPNHQTSSLLTLMIIGGVLFLVGGQTAVRGQFWQGIILIGRAVSRYLSLSAWQLLLLLVAPLFMWLTFLAAGSELTAVHRTVANVSWLIGIILVIGGSYRWQPGEPLSRWELRLLAFLFVFALVLRGLLTDAIPSTFSGDEGAAGLMAVEFARGNANNWFVTGWFSFPSLYFALQSLGIHLWGQTIIGVRLISAFAGGVAVIAVYWMTRTLFDRKTAVFAALYLAASHYHIHISRLALNNVWDSLFGAAAIYGLWDGWQNGRRLSFVLCGMSLGFGMYFYVSIRILPVIFVLWALIALLVNRRQFMARLPDLMLTTWISTTIALPIGIYFYNHPAQFNAPLNRVTILGSWLEAEISRTGLTGLQIILQQMWLGVLGFVYQPLRLFYEPGAPLLLTGAATLFLIGFVWGLLNFDLRYLLLLLPLVTAVVSNGLSQSPPASQRYILAMPVVAVFVALPLGHMVNWFESFWPEKHWIAYVITGGIMAAVVIQDLNFYFFEIPDYYVFGGINTLIASEVVDYLDEASDTEKVYFLGLPRMGYYSLATISYLKPSVEGVDIIEPLSTAPDWELTGVTQFIFLPERANEFEPVQQAYPSGRYYEIYDDHNEILLFTVYEVEG